MQTIGERLEEARKRQGISLRDAAEATKIRGDFLEALEDNSMDVPLPEIYVRGFLKNYARYLKLDVDKVIADYEAMMPGSRARQHPNQQHEFLGRMDFDDPPSRTPGQMTEDEDDEENTFESSRPIKKPTNMAAYKVALMAGGIAVVALIIYLIASAFTGGKPAPGSNGPDRPNDPVVERGSPLENASARAITLIAQGNVIVQAKEVGSGRILLVENLPAGTERQVSFDGRVQIRFNKGENLRLRYAGQELEIGKTGRGVVELP